MKNEKWQMKVYVEREFVIFYAYPGRTLGLYVVIDIVRINSLINGLSVMISDVNVLRKFV